MKKVFRSQLCYGAFGGRICTAVSYAVAHAFLLLCQEEEDAMEFFSEDRVHEIMQKCSRLFEESPFAQKGLMMSVFDMMQLCPAGDTIDNMEIAGLVMAPTRQLALQEAENLWVESLHTVLQKLCHSCLKKRMAAVVTIDDHTVAFLLDEGRVLYLFDPLPANLVRCENTLQQILRCDQKEYSGYLFCKKNELSAACDDDVLH